MGEVPLSDEPLPREKRRRPRWVDALGITGAVVVVLVIGSLGDDGTDDATPPPTSTTLSTSTTTTEPTTTSTSQPSTIVFGKLLPRKTGTVIALLGTESPKLLDLDSGTLRPTPYGQDWPMLPGDHGFVAFRDGNRYFVPSAGGPPEVVETDAAPQGFLSGSSSSWVQSPGDGARWHELDGRGVRTGASIELPIDAYPSAAVDDGLVVSQHGTLTLVRRSGELRSLGEGDVIGGAGRMILRLVCERFRCRVDVVDVRTGRARAVTGPVTGLCCARFASSGTWMTYVSQTSSGGSTLVVVDLRTMGVKTLGELEGASAFTVDGDYLLVTEGGILRAYDLEEHRWIDATQVGTTAGTLLAVAAG